MLKHLVPLNLPKPALKLAKKNNTPMVWDNLRKKYLVLTPEEWVRQHAVHYMFQLGYPASNLALEGGFEQNARLKRTDILAYKNGDPMVLVECKAPQVKITQQTMDQAARYNLHYKAKFLFLTNGLSHYCAQTLPGKETFTFLKDLPSYDQL